MDIQDNHFTLFGLPERFAIDAAALDRAYREVQTQVHPDRFARGSATEQRVAMQWATRANEAYRVLRDPLRRAIYLCTLRGTDPANENDTKMPQAFLMQQLEWREALDAARATTGTEAIMTIRSQLEVKRAQLAAGVEQALDRERDAATASRCVREWMFIERLGEEVASAARAPVH